MKRNISITPQIRTLKSLLDEIKLGKISVPPFQRDFVWTRDQIKDLFQSIQKNYPIGSVLLWKPDQKYEWNPNFTIGKYRLNEVQGENIYILDGYQRLSTVFSCLMSPLLTNMELNEDVDDSLFDLYYDLQDESFIYLRSISLRQPYQVPMYVFMSTSEFRKYARMNIEGKVDAKLIDLYLDRADDLSRRLADYQMASVEIKEANISEAVEIFSRLNSKGVDISMDWMLNALTYNDNFRFADVIDELISEVDYQGFGELNRNMLFRCFQSSFGKLYIDQSEVEKLAKLPDFENQIYKSIANIKKAVSFLQDEIRMPSVQFLPYGTQLVFLMLFFDKYPEATKQELSNIEQWFWKTTYSNYFTICPLGEQRKAYNHFMHCLDTHRLDELFYPSNKDAFETLKFPLKIQLSAVRSKAVCLFIEKNLPQIATLVTSKRSAAYDKIISANRDYIKECEKLFVGNLGMLYSM